MNTTRFEGKTLIYPLDDYFWKLPREVRVCNIYSYLAELWEKCKQRQHMNKEHVKIAIGKGLYSNRRVFDQYLNGTRTPTLEFVRLFCDFCRSLRVRVDDARLNTGVFKFGHGGNAASAHLPLFLTPKLAYLVGAMRDGTLARHGKYEVTYSQSNIEWLEFVKNMIIDVFSPSNRPRIAYGNRTTLSNRPIFEFFHRIFEVPIGEKVRWDTPSIIKKAPFCIQKYYIRGFYDADGLSELGFCQANDKPLHDIKTMLEKQGIKCGSVNKRPLQLGKKYPMYTLLISRRNGNHFRFIKVVGCSNNSKSKYFPSVLNTTS